MEIKYQKHNKRKQKAVSFWLQVAADYNNGMTAQQIAQKYTNPLTQRPYTRQHVYLILRKVRNGL